VLEAGAVKVTDPPWQKTVEPLAEMVAAGSEYTVTVTGEDTAEEPPEAVTVTV
jgi:hypothetical protein